MKIFQARNAPLNLGAAILQLEAPDDEFYKTARPVMKDPAAGRRQLLARSTD